MWNGMIRKGIIFFRIQTKNYDISHIWFACKFDRKSDIQKNMHEEAKPLLCVGDRERSIVTEIQAINNDQCSGPSSMYQMYFYILGWSYT